MEMRNEIGSSMSLVMLILVKDVPLQFWGREKFHDAATPTFIASFKQFLYWLFQ